MPTAWGAGVSVGWHPLGHKKGCADLWLAEVEGSGMDVGGIGWTLGRAGRRWVIAALVVILASAATWVLVPTQYQSQVQLAMTAPTTGNPYLTFNTSLTSDVDLLTRNLTSQASGQQLQALGLDGTSYTAVIPVNALGPFFQLTVSGSNQAQVTRSMQVLIKFAEQRWRSLQLASSAPADSVIGLSLIAPASTPTATLKRKLEEVIGVAVVVIVLTLLIGSYTDGVSRRRQQMQVQRIKPTYPERSTQAAPTV